MVCISPDGRRVAATAPQTRSALSPAGLRRRVRGAVVFQPKGAALAYSPDGRWLAVRDGDENTVLLLDAQTCTETRRRIPWSREARVRGPRSIPTARRLASCNMDRTVRLWQIDSGGCQVLRLGTPIEVFAAAFRGGRRPGNGRPRQGGLAVGPGGARSGGCQGTPATSGRWPSAPTASTLASGSGTSRSACGTPRP